MKHGQSFRVVSVFHPWLFAGPPPPANWNWRSGVYFPRKTRIFGISAAIWRKGVPTRAVVFPLVFAPTNEHHPVCHLLEIVGNIHVLALVITSEQAVRRGRDGRIER